MIDKLTIIDKEDLLFYHGLYLDPPKESDMLFLKEPEMENIVWGPLKIWLDEVIYNFLFQLQMDYYSIKYASDLSNKSKENI